MSSVRRILYPGRQYLWRDEFNDDRAINTLSGTPASPGPGTRLVTDTNGRISIAAGLLNFATGAAINDGWWLSSPLIARLNGRVGSFRVTPSDTNGIINVGLDANTSGAITDCLVFAAAGALQVIANGGTAIAVGVYTATPYEVKAIMRATGMYWLIRGGVFTTWTLLRPTSLGTAAAYAAITAGSITSVFTADYDRGPARIFLLPVLAHDTFTRDNGAIGSTESAGPDGQGAPILAWTGVTWTILTNKAINTPILGAEENSGNLVVGAWYSITATQANYFYIGCAIADTFRATAATALDVNNKVKAITLATLFATLPDMGTPNVVINATLAAYTSPTQMGIVARLDSTVAPANFVFAYRDGSNLKVAECVAGVYTQLSSINSTYGANDVLRLDLSGANWRFYKTTGAGIEAFFAASTTNVLTGNLHGMFGTLAGAGNAFSKFTVMQKAGYSPRAE